MTKKKRMCGDGAMISDVIRIPVRWARAIVVSSFSETTNPTEIPPPVLAVSSVDAEADGEVSSESSAISSTFVSPAPRNTISVLGEGRIR